jgi:predicted GNAT family acetyltransferase
MGTNNLKSFLQAIVGTDGSKALICASERSPEIEAVLIPRTIVAWLNLPGNMQYENTVPGIENSYLKFAKSEDGYTGSITIDNSVYEFQNVSLTHFASAMSVAVGVDVSGCKCDLRDSDLVRLGKSIDILAKSNLITQYLAQEELSKAISSIPAGPEIREPKAATSKVYDYSHVLSPQHQKTGYSMQVRHKPDSGSVSGHIYRNGLEVGTVKGSHENGSLKIEDAEVQDQHQGKGLGSSLYEGLMAHALHSGVKNVAGAVHSTSASKVHQKLSSKHGMNYRPTPTPFPKLAAPTPGPYDSRMGPYEYAIKTELEPAGQEGPGKPQAQFAPKEPIKPTPPKQTAETPKLKLLFKGMSATPTKDGVIVSLGNTELDEDAFGV